MNGSAFGIALFSYIIARAETIQAELASYQYLAKVNWQELLINNGFERTWVDLIDSWMACSKTPCTGVFLHLPPRDESQPHVEWLHRLNIPVWYPWGKEQASNVKWASLAPPVHLLQSGTETIMTKHPSTATTKDTSTSESNVTSGSEATSTSEGDVSPTPEGDPHSASGGGSSTQPILAPIEMMNVSSSDSTPKGDANTASQGGPSTRPIPAPVVTMNVTPSTDTHEHPNKSPSWQKNFLSQEERNLRQLERESPRDRERRLAEKENLQSKVLRYFTGRKTVPGSAYVRLFLRNGERIRWPTTR